MHSNVIADSKQNFNLHVQNSSFSFREGTVYNANNFEVAKITSPDLFNASNFDHVKRQKVVFEMKDSRPVLNFIPGSTLILDRVSFITGSSSAPYNVDKIGDVKKVKLKLNKAI